MTVKVRAGDWPYYVTESVIKDIVERGLAEDVGGGDVTTRATIAGGVVASGSIVAKEPGVLAGAAVAERVFAALDSLVAVDWLAADGDAVDANTILGRISGPAAPILSAERLALNILQRMSGIATATRLLAATLEPFGTRILDTRKTAPGLRALDKWSVLLGGGANHRLGLYDMILIKENHIAAAGSITAAVLAAVRHLGTASPAVQVEVEVRTLDEVREALDLEGVDMLLLDNMVRRTTEGTLDTDLLRSALAIVDHTVPTEASGNMDAETAVAAAACGVDYVSVGALTHSVTALDISLLLDVKDAVGGP